MQRSLCLFANHLLLAGRWIGLFGLYFSWFDNFLLLCRGWGLLLWGLEMFRRFFELPGGCNSRNFIRLFDYRPYFAAYDIRISMQLNHS